MKWLRTILIFHALTPFACSEVISVLHPREAFPADKTVVWSPLFQAAWDEMNRSFAGPLLKVEPPNPLMAKLDSFRWDKDKTLPEGSWKTWSGPATEEFLQQVNREAAQLTGDAEGPFTIEHFAPIQKAIFALLDREVEFERAFSRSKKAPMEFRVGAEKNPVQFFGTRDEATGNYRDSIRVLSWRPIDGSHAIQVLCKDSEDTIIFYLPASPQDFATACLWLRTWRSQNDSELDPLGKWNDDAVHAGDEIRIPYVTLDTKEDFKSSLGGMRYYRNEKLSWQIGRALQKIQFKLHERGAKVKVDVSLDPFAGGPPVTIERKFLYDRPFFVFLWRAKAEWPYFGAWIGDASALEKFQ